MLSQLRQHKFKIFSFLIMILFLVIFYFPYDDLGDWVTVKVSEATQRQVFLQFEKMGFSLFPQPGVKFTHVYVESVFLPNLKVGSLALAPSVKGLLTFRPGVTIYAEDILKGQVQLSTRGGEKTKDGSYKQILSLSLEQVSLEQLMELANALVKLQGAIHGDVQATVDTNFSEQPIGKIDLTIKEFTLPSSNVPTPIGPLNLPELKISSLQIKGHLTSGELYIDNIEVGNSKDELNGTIKGQIQMILAKRGIEISPQFGRFDINVDLKALPTFEKKAALFLTFLDAYKKPQIGGSRYALKLTGFGFSAPPRMQALE